VFPAHPLLGIGIGMLFGFSIADFFFRNKCERLVKFWNFVKQTEMAILRFINRPIVNHYETREKNYKDIISKLEKQLYDDNQNEKIDGILSELTPVENITGSFSGILYLENEDNDYHDRLRAMQHRHQERVKHVQTKIRNNQS
jgi:hypothetical protein